jgi:hypothetical protein
MDNNGKWPLGWQKRFKAWRCLNFGKKADAD